MNDFIIEPGIDAVLLPGEIHGCEMAMHMRNDVSC